MIVVVDLIQVCFYLFIFFSESELSELAKLNCFGFECDVSSQTGLDLRIVTCIV